MLLSFEAAIRLGRTFRVLSVPLFILIWAFPKHGQRLVGVAPKRDHARKAILSRSSVEALTREITTCPFVFVSPRHNVEECMAVMTKHRFRHLPVVQEDAVVGLVLIGDLVKWISRGQAQVI